MKTKVKYQLVEIEKDKQVLIGPLLDSLEACDTFVNKLKEYGVSKVFKIKMITTVITESYLPSFTLEAAAEPAWEDVAAEISSIYSGQVDYDIEDFKRLSEEDKKKVKEYVGNYTDCCESCGWEFSVDYLNHTSIGLVCENCESIEEEEKDEYEEED